MVDITQSQDDAATSLRRHDRGFNTTTGRSLDGALLLSASNFKLDPFASGQTLNAIPLGDKAIISEFRL